MAEDPYRYFRVEARELLEAISRGVLELEKGPARPEQVAGILRQAHTLKGAARVVRVTRIADQAHAMEEALQPYREAGGEIPGAVVSSVLGLLDSVRAGLGTLEPAPAAAGDETFETVRVEVREVDRLLEALGEVQQLAHERAERLGRGVVRLRSAAERLRLVPAGAIFGALERAVRDAAQAVGRRVEFRASGGEHRLDAQVLGPLRDALIHVVRNSVAHGIEPESERRIAGKPPAGRVELRVEKRGSRAAFVCEDDGRGIDVEAVRREAQRKGWVDASGWDEAAAVRVLLRGGLSTSGEATSVAGRGIGLSVVRDVAARLQGALEIASRRGRGTTLDLCVPISMASTLSLVVVAGGVPASVPLASVQRTLRVRPEEMAESADRVTIACDGESVPFARLSELMGREAAHEGRVSVLVVASDGRRAAIGVDGVVGVRDVVVRTVPEWVGADPLVAGVSVDERGRPRAALDPRALVRAAVEARPRPVAPSAPKPAILVVDDSLTTRMLEQSILESAGYAVDLACSGEEALAMARRRRYALWIVDVEMPGMDGFELLGRLRADPDLARVPSLIVTSRDTPEDRRRGEDAGARGYVVKSRFDQGELLALIRQWVG
jgi:two-component system chemotaxis sensor kinase CheA